MTPTCAEVTLNTVQSKLALADNLRFYDLPN